jgi:pimeloyl-ACP methyl ester carboxylesterase
MVPVQRHTVRTGHGPDLSVLAWAANPAAPVLVCLHGHFGQGAIYAPLAEALAPAWRVVAPDQRGHGWSGHAADYGRADYLADVAAVLDALAIPRCVLLGSSLGGVNAYQFAARHPDRVAALVVEDIGAVRQDDLGWCLGWPRRFPTLAALQAAVHPYFAASAVERDDGWDFRFDRPGIVRSQQALNGDGWADWLASTCPALLLRGGDSTILSADHAAAMAARRPRTVLRTFPGVGHNINDGDPAGFIAAVRAFLELSGP